METRKLNFGDAFRLAAIVKRANIKKELTDLIEDVTKRGEKDTEKVGISLVLTVVESAPSAQKEICEFIGSITGTTAEEIESTPIDEIIAIIKQIIKENDVKSFFTSALK